MAGIYLYRMNPSLYMILQQQREKENGFSKNKRNQDLTIEEKEYNKSHSKKRIVVEQAICRLKKV